MPLKSNVRPSPKQSFIRGSVAIFILLRQLRLESIRIDVEVGAVGDRGQHQGRDALPLLLSLEVCEAGRGRLGEQFLRQPLRPRFVALNVGIGAGRDVFLDLCLDPPQEALAHDCPPICCVWFGAGFPAHSYSPDTLVQVNRSILHGIENRRDA